MTVSGAWSDALANRVAIGELTMGTPIDAARFVADLLRNPNNASILRRWTSLGLPDGWLAAGCLFQTVWNLRSGYPPAQGIKDYDFFYFNGSDLSAEAEAARQRQVSDQLADLGITVEVANQARVHCWYERYFGHPYDPLTCSADGIARFLVTETCVGIRPAGDCPTPITAGRLSGVAR